MLLVKWDLGFGEKHSLRHRNMNSEIMCVLGVCEHVYVCMYMCLCVCLCGSDKERVIVCAALVSTQEII